MGKLRAFGILIFLLGLQIALSSQSSPKLQWDMTAGSAMEVQAYQYELWINGTGQLPLRTATCVGIAPKIVCTDNAGIPSQTEGIKNFQLLAITPQGIKSLLSPSFPITYPSIPTNLRLTN